MAAVVEQRLQRLGSDLTVEAETVGAGADPPARFLAGGQVVVLQTAGHLAVVIAPAAQRHLGQTVQRESPPNSWQPLATLGVQGCQPLVVRWRLWGMSGWL